MCRHTVGLNWTAIGIEHVGTSDAGVVTNRRQLAASLRLTRWLQARFGIETRNVIGHSESLRSPYHHERVPALKHQTHADFSHATMRRYRRWLGRGGAAAATPVTHRLHLGRSVLGRPIDAIVNGDQGPPGNPPRKVLVVGAIHGNEPAGIAIVRRLERLAVPRGAQLILVEAVNPDGVAAGKRQNARGVDLNRNFSWRWRRAGQPGSVMYSGPHPLSEPESRIARTLIRSVRPKITIWFHQHLRLVDRSGGDVRVERRFARLVHLPLRKITPYPGTATRWQNHSFPSSTAFVVELPAGRLNASQQERFAGAVLALGSE
jgi:protein MpaA